MNGDECQALISWTGRAPALHRSEVLFVGYSVKNRRFSRDFFLKVGELAKNCFSKLVIAIFDVPYAYNEAAHRDEEHPSRDEFAKCIDIGDERERMIRRALSAIANARYEIRRWPELDTSCAVELRDELSAAIHKDDALRDELIQNIRAWCGLHACAPDHFLGFQLSEIPVLMDLYYRQGFLSDIYPGQLNDFFFKLERGEWSHALPVATQLASTRHLCCLRLEPREKRGAELLLHTAVPKNNARWERPYP